MFFIIFTQFSFFFILFIPLCIPNASQNHKVIIQIFKVTRIFRLQSVRLFLRFI